MLKPRARKAAGGVFTLGLVFGQTFGRLRGLAHAVLEPEVPEIGVSGPVHEDAGELFFPFATRMRPRPLESGAEALPSRPAVVLRLADVLDSHWERCDVVGPKEESLQLNVHFSLSGEAFLAVRGASWPDPVFLRFKAGMSGSWQVGGAQYRLGLDVNLFRRELNNYVVIYKNGAKTPVYRRRIQDLLVISYESGREISIAGRTYRLFCSYDLDPSQTPPAIDRSRLDIMLVRGTKDERGEYSLNPYVLSAADLEQRLVSGDFGGQRLGLRISAGFLEIYDLSGN